MNFIVYDGSTGRILWTGGCPPDVIHLQASGVTGGASLEGVADGQRQYVYNGQIVGRPLMDTHPMTISKTDNVAEDEVITIRGVPANADIYIDGEKHNLDPGEAEMEITFDTVGTYTIRVVAFPFQDWERTVTVV